MSALDILILLMVAGGLLVGFVRGLTTELLNLAAWVAGIVAVRLFHSPLADRLVDWTGGGASASILAFALLFLPVYGGVKLFAKAVGSRAKRSVLGPIDRLLGAGFGAVKGILIATLWFLLMNIGTDIIYGAEAERPAWMRDSKSYPLLQASSKAVVDWVDERRQKPELIENDNSDG